MHRYDALIYGVRHGKLIAARIAYVLAVVTWAAWMRGRPWDPVYRIRFGR